MRHSLNAFSVALAAGVSLIALAGALPQPALADTPDVGQQQKRVDQLQSKAESLRQEAQQLGGSRTVRQSINNVKTRINEYDEDIAHTEERIEKMKVNKADLDRAREEVEKESVFGAGDAVETGVKHKVLEAVEEKLTHNAGRAVGALGWVAIFVKVGGKTYYRWVRKNDLRAQGIKESNQITDKYRFIRFAQEERNKESANLKRLQEIEEEERKNNALIGNERDKLRRMTEPGFKGGIGDADLERDQDLPGDESERSKDRAWKGIRKVSMGGGYFEAEAPEQFVGRIVIDGDDFAMLYTPGTLDGFYAEAAGEFPLDHAPSWGEQAAFDLNFRYTDLEGDAFRFVEADPAITTGFVFIDPLDPTIPFAVGLGSTNLAWNAHASSSQTGVAFTATYREYVGLQYGLDGSLGVGLMADYRSTEHNTRIENLDFAGFAVDENYDFETFGFGPRIEGMLEWDCDPDEDGPYPSIESRLRAFVAGTYDWRDLAVAQRATGPFFGGFDHRQRVSFDEDGFNVRYGADLTLDLKFDQRTTAFATLGWQGQSDAPTIIPADGSFAPGLRVAADTQDQDDWYAGVGIRIEF
jgi:hypothetical protein